MQRCRGEYHAVVAAPDYVPIDPSRRVRSYSSPPRRADAWVADRAGDLQGPAPSGPALGTAGPDAGYAYRLVHLFDDRLHLGYVAKEDAIAGCVEVAMKRAALFGRAPIVHDLTVAFTIYGFLDPDPDVELAERRRREFAEIRSSHHYSERRYVVDRVAEAALRTSHDAIGAAYEADWRSLFVDL